MQGIVAQTRNNNIGGDGIANNVEIMTIHCRSDGDEYDKDIALAIRYAVTMVLKLSTEVLEKFFTTKAMGV